MIWNKNIFANFSCFVFVIKIPNLNNVRKKDLFWA